MEDLQTKCDVPCLEYHAEMVLECRDLCQDPWERCFHMTVSNQEDAAEDSIMGILWDEK